MSKYRYFAVITKAINYVKQDRRIKIFPLWSKTFGRLKYSVKHTASSDSPARIDDTDIVSNMPSELMIVIPELDAGTWQIEVVTQYGGNSRQLLKEPRTAVFDRILTVS